jgi:glycosyltransferase involved in cell wall biosynthesis
MGRLHVAKRFDRLIAAFAATASANPGWDLEIWGEGPLRANLEAQVRDCGLDGRVRLPGSTRNPTTAMQRAGIFVLSSEYEGFPLALTEAMACGMPVISFRCPSGPSDLIRDGVDGILVPPGDVAALAGAIQRLMRDSDLRTRLAARAPDVLKRFSLERVMGLWERTIDDVVAARAHAKRGLIRRVRI